LQDISYEFGWGPDQGRTDVRSYIKEIAAEFAQGLGMGIVQDTSTVRLVGKYTNAQVYEEFMGRTDEQGRPLLRELHISDFDMVNGKPRENLIPGTGKIGQELKEIVADAKKHDIRIVYELRGYANVPEAVQKTLDFLVS